MERYGSKCSLINDIVIEKTKKTNMEKYGCENPSQNPLVINKILQKHHEKSVEEINNIVEKRKNTIKRNNWYLFKIS